MRFILWLLLWPVAAAAGQNLLISTEDLAAAQAQRPLALIDA